MVDSSSVVKVLIAKAIYSKVIDSVWNVKKNKILITAAGPVLQFKVLWKVNQDTVQCFSSAHMTPS
jgi:hypothetical protein